MSYNILTVDDSSIVRRSIHKSLELSGLPVKELHQAENGQQALDILEAEWIDLVLTDINMPVMNGIELKRRMVDNDLMCKIPVVVISSDGSEQRVRELNELGVHEYLSKPFTPEELKNAVERALGVKSDG